LPGELLYLDSSALVKLVIVEPESGPLAEVLTDWPAQVSSIVATVEIRRAARRAAAAPAVNARADQVAAQLGLVFLTPEVAREAAEIRPHGLRSLDAIHLASALSLGDDLGGFATYDARIASAAETAGLSVVAPG